MVGQIVEISEAGYSLKKYRGFLEVYKRGEKIGQVHIDDIATVLISVPGSLISSVLIDHLSRQNVPIVICGENYYPSTITLPLEGYSRQYQVMSAQAKISEPKRKRAWQRIVQAKISNQAELLVRVGEEGKQLERLARKVRSGDPENYEAQAARLYWQRLFGKTFRRDRAALGLNSAINYTYAIVRSCVARGVCSAGLHPTFGLHHKNPRNALNLVDDLLEPFRPIADYLVWASCDRDFDELSVEMKHRLAGITSVLVPLGSEASPLSLIAVKVCKSFSSYVLGERQSIELPELPTPIDINMMSVSMSGEDQ